MILNRCRSRILIAFTGCLLVAVSAGQAVQDDPEVVKTALEEADKLFEEARGLYEKAKAGASVPVYNDAGFKAEDARTKYRAVQELAKGAARQKAIDQLQQVAQLLKLINDGRLAIKDPPAEKPAEKPSIPPAPKAPEAPPAPSKPPEPPTRAAIPDAAQLKDAEKTVKDIFKAEYARKSAADRATLARLLLTSAASQSNPAERWVCLSQAQELATQAGDWDVAWDAITRSSIAFE
jgi:hypothetical protein